MILRRLIGVFLMICSTGDSSCLIGPGYLMVVIPLLPDRFFHIDRGVQGYTCNVLGKSTISVRNKDNARGVSALRVFLF